MNKLVTKIMIFVFAIALLLVVNAKAEQNSKRVLVEKAIPQISQEKTSRDVRIDEVKSEIRADYKKTFRARKSVAKEKQKAIVDNMLRYTDYLNNILSKNKIRNTYVVAPSIHLSPTSSKNLEGKHEFVEKLLSKDFLSDSFKKEIMNDPKCTVLEDSNKLRRIEFDFRTRNRVNNYTGRPYKLITKVTVFIYKNGLIYVHKHTLEDSSKKSNSKYYELDTKNP